MKEYKQYLKLEKFIYGLMRVGIILSLFMGIIIITCHVKTVFFIKTALIIFTTSMILLGLWMSLGTIFQWESFIKETKIRGSVRDFGRIKGGLVNILFGFLSAVFMLYIIYLILTNDSETLGEIFRNRN